MHLFQQYFNCFKQIIVPSLDDIQQAINQVMQLILEVSRGVAQWGQRHVQKSNLKAEPGTWQASSAGFGSPGKTDKGNKRSKGESECVFVCLFFLLISTFYFNKNAIYKYLWINSFFFKEAKSRLSWIIWRRVIFFN